MGRIIAKLKYEITNEGKRESDVDQGSIYAFRYEDDICVLSRKDDKFFWDCLKSAASTWYIKYDTIDEAIEATVKMGEFTEPGNDKPPDIWEFYTTKELINWAYKQFNPEK